MVLNANSIVVQEPEPVVATVDGDTVMLSERAGAYFGLNDIGSAIWALIEKPCRVADLCSALHQQYDRDSISIGADVIEFLELMAAHKLIRVLDADEAL